MAEFPVNPNRLDPYKGTNFLVYFGPSTTPVPGIRQVSGLRWDTQVISYREGGAANLYVLAPGSTTFEPVVLTRGRTQDASFEEWAALVWNMQPGSVALNEMRKEVRIALLNEAHQIVMAFVLHRCWPIRYEALGPLDAMDTAIALESITLQYEGFSRDTSVAEPKQP